MKTAPRDEQAAQLISGLDFGLLRILQQRFEEVAQAVKIFQR